MENAGFFSRMFPVWNVSRHRAPGKERHVAGVVGNTDFCPGSLRAVTAKPGPWDKSKARDGEARGLRVTCHRFPGAKLAEPCPFSRMGRTFASIR